MKTPILAFFFASSLCFSSGMAAESIAQRKVSSPQGDGEKVRLGRAVLQAGVPAKPVREAFAYFDEHRERIANQRYMTIIDYSRPSHEERMWVIDLEKGEVERRLVSHGAGRGERSNPRDVPRFFSNTPGSREGSVGFYITGSEYNSPKFERALNLLGQEESNSNAYERRIVFHGADYVNEEKGEAGRSWGCPAVDNLHAFRLIDQLKDGSLFYITLADPVPEALAAE